MLAREFQSGIRNDLHHKDMGIVIVAAGDASVSVLTKVSADEGGLMKVVEVLNGES